jgi:hypothetical protein
MPGHQADAAGEASTKARPLGPAILRVAAWPIDTLEVLRSPNHSSRIDRWIAHEGEIQRTSRLLAAQLRELIPNMEQRKARSAALSLKRALTRTCGPLPPRLSQSVLQNAAIPAALRRALLDDAGERERHAAERANIEEAHSAELDRAGAALDNIVQERDFQRALCVASASLFDQFRKARCATPSRRSRQRLQSVMHRYLMRAIGRATPNGLWAGVAVEALAENAQAPIEVRPAPSIVRISPVLSVFLRALAHLNRTRPWIEQLTWRRNPTLRRIADAKWEFGTFSSGFWVAGQVADNAALDVLLKKFDATERPLLQEIERALCASITGVTPSLARTICESWVEAGILWSSASLPPFFSDTWQALQAIIRMLPNNEAELWKASVSALRSIADRIESDMETMEPDALRNQFDAAHGLVKNLLGRYSAELRPNEHVLALDQTAPFCFSLSHRLSDQLARQLRDYWAFDRYGLGEIETRVSIFHFFDAAADTRVPLSEFLTRGAESDPAQRAWSWQDRVLPRAVGGFEAAARFAFDRWEREIEPVSAQRVYRLRGHDPRGRLNALPPGSALLLLAFPSKSGATPVRIGGITPEPCFFYSRFAHLFGSDDPFPTWHRAGVARAVDQWPLDFRDLAIRNHLNSNVTARPPSTLPLADPLDADDGLLSCGLISFNHRGRPTLTLAGTDRHIIASARSAAYLGGLDRIASVLASVSFFLGRPPLMAPIPRLNREIEAWHHLPRLLLDDAVISPERWTPNSHFGTALSQARGAERLIVWRRYVQANALPDLVYTFQGGHQTESLLATDSALAVELLGQELQAHGPTLRIQELWPQPNDFVVFDRQGRRYVAELAVPWHADDAFWDDYSSDGSKSPAGSAA